MSDIAENVFIMVMTVVCLLGGGYLLLVLLDIWLKFKSGSREQDGLADLLVSARIDASRQQEPRKNASTKDLEQNNKDPNPLS